MDVLFILATWFLVTEHVSSSFLHKCSFLVLAALNSSLLLIDHIHFQYNGMLIGLMLLSLWACRNRDSILLTGYFSVLVLMKHLFAPVAPVFAVVVIISIIRNHGFALRLKLFSQIFSIAVGFLIAAFYPFVCADGTRQLVQIFNRLFPFGRGLVHAYWAPNFWAFYYFVDKMLSLAFESLGFNELITKSHGFSSSAGKVGVFSLAVLPNVEASHCLCIVATGILFFSGLLFFNFSFLRTLRCLVVSSLFSFMFGYHVHEKAIIVTLFLQMILSFFSCSKVDLFIFRLLSMSAVVSIFPLLPGNLEWIVKGM
jgi:alpha-1,3-glucosyltransferase